MNEPTVTIVVPTYRRLHYLREALASALAQTYKDFELIVSDDSSSDEIADYVASLKDPRLRYRRNAKNLGIAMNNYAAFSEAKGSYIASLHDDDVWEQGFLAALVPVLEADGEITVAFSDHYVIDENGHLLSERSDKSTHFFKRDQLQPGRHQPFIRPVVIDLVIPMVMAAVFRKSILEGAKYSPRVGGSYDYWLAYLAVKDGKAVYYVPQRLTRYRVHSQSGTMSRGVHNLWDSIYVRRITLAMPEVASYRREIRNGLGIFYGKIALFYLARRSFWRGRVFLKQAFSLLNRPKNILALVANSVMVLCKGPKR
jgi:glycosyltransferase involved in cell wall biosynthesis